MIAWTIYITFAGAFGLLFMPRFFTRWIALATALAGFVIQAAHPAQQLARRGGAGGRAVAQRQQYHLVPPALQQPVRALLRVHEFTLPATGFLR